MVRALALVVEIVPIKVRTLSAIHWDDPTGREWKTSSW